MDLDINMHKSNSTFFADADINRAELLTRLLSRGLAAAGPKDSKSAPTAIPLLAAVQCSFKREIGPFQAYDISSRILAWDDKSLFMVTYFLKRGARLSPDLEVDGGPAGVLGDSGVRRSVYAVMVTRYVCKAGRETVAPKTVLEASGLLDGGKEADDVSKAVESGMKYVRECMV
jgi:hypothetical protein